MVTVGLGWRIAERIGAEGPIPVSEYVEACLYDPVDGFYTRRGGGRAGRRLGDFVTAPEVGPLFGAVVARALDRWWRQYGSPERFTVVDWGAGPGTLARSVLKAQPDCLTSGALRWLALDLSVAQRELHPKHPTVTSAAHVPRDFICPGDVGVVVANELLDNLPFDIVERIDGGWQELRVTGRQSEPGDKLSFTLISSTAAPDLVDDLPDGAPIGARIPVQRAARRWVQAAIRLFDAGRVVVFDYGADTCTLARRSLRTAQGSTPESEPSASLDESTSTGARDVEDFGWLRTHRHHSSNSSWLEYPGHCDITTDVALDQVQADQVAQVSTQAEFLQHHGIDQLVAQGRKRWTQRSHIGDLAALAARSCASEAAGLLDPDGMGSFSVLQWHCGASANADAFFER